MHIDYTGTTFCVKNYPNIKPGRLLNNIEEMQIEFLCSKVVIVIIVPKGWRADHSDALDSSSVYVALATLTQDSV